MYNIFQHSFNIQGANNLAFLLIFGGQQQLVISKAARLQSLAKILKNVIKQSCLESNINTIIPGSIKNRISAVVKLI